MTRPDPSARELAEQMLADDDVQSTIITETIQSARQGQTLESGRSLCGDPSDIREPVARYPTVTDFAMCPAGQRTAMWHTHPSREQLEQPTLSIPDVGLVLYRDGVSVNAVSGIQSSEAILSPQDREEAIRTFNDVLGVETNELGQVVEAVRNGQVGDLEQTRDELRRELSPLFVRRYNTFPTLMQEAQAVEAYTPSMTAPAAYAMSTGELVASCSVYDTTEDKTAVEKHRERCDCARDALKTYAWSDNVDLQSTIITSVIGGVASTVVTRVLFD